MDLLSLIPTNGVRSVWSSYSVSSREFNDLAGHILQEETTKAEFRPKTL